MTKIELIELALKNARSHYPDAVISDELRSYLDRFLYLSVIGIAVKPTSFSRGSINKKRRLQCIDIEFVTDRVLDANNYYGDRRTFCCVGLNCNCDIPCGA